MDGQGTQIPVTASVGLACLTVDETVDNLMNRADRAMYAAKYGGRNRVGVDTDDAEPRLLTAPPRLRLSI
jgi:PleD family two-component response regulator